MVLGGIAGAGPAKGSTLNVAPRDLSQGDISSVSVEGTRAYIAGGERFAVLDVSNPSAPVALGETPGGRADALWVAGQYAYTADFIPGLNNTAQSIDVPGTLAVAITDQCPTVERRYIGSNRGCWRNAEFDRLYLVASTALDPRERDQAGIEAIKILTEEVGVFGLAYNSENIAVRKGLVGPGPRWPAQVGNTWNVHEWRWE